MIKRLSCRSVRFRVAAFTLVELLVVIAIIAILAALAIPAAQSFLGRGTKAKDVSNIRNISTLVLTYVSDSGRLPGPVFRTVRNDLFPKSTNYLDGFLAVRGYVSKNDAIWTTPSGYVTNSAYLLNNTSKSDPANFFGYPTSTNVVRPLAALKGNLRASLNPTVTNTASLGGIWLVTNADGDNYSSDLTEGASSAHPKDLRTPWGGRHYSFFDGSVRFIPRQDPSIYPSSETGKHN